MDTDGAGQESFVTALNTVFGRAFSFEGYSTSGKTDTQIAIELGERSDVSEAEMIERLDEVRELYLAGLKVELAGITPTVFSGIRELVSSVSEHSGCVSGLLTGNFEPGAWMKLDRIDLSEPFQMGSFGDGARARKDLPGKAVTRARELTGQDFIGKDVVVIGIHRMMWRAAVILALSRSLWPRVSLTKLNWARRSRIISLLIFQIQSVCWTRFWNSGHRAETDCRGAASLVTGIWLDPL